MEYPLKFTKCPNCGSESRAIESVVKEEIENGTIKPDSKFALLMTQTPIFDATQVKVLAPRKIPLMLGYFDVCTACGTFYCVEMHKNTGLVEPKLDGPGIRGGGPDGLPFSKS